MSDRGEGAAAQTFSDGLTAGMLLRRAREAAGLHVAALAVSLKVPVRKLEALETDRFDLLPDLVFARALASSVCRTLRVDPQPILERLPLKAAPRLVQDRDGINAPFRAPSDMAPPSWLDQMSRPVVLSVFALLLGALVLVFLPRSFIEDVVATSQTPVQSQAQPEAVGAPMPITVGPAAPEPAAPAQSSGGAPALVPSASLAAVSPPATAPMTPAAVPAAPAADPASAPAVAAREFPAASGIVVFRTKGPSWVEVTDAKGVVALRRLLAAGESAGVSGALPLSVTIGRASATEVQVRGKVFDLAAVSRDDVARFEVR
ncbi:MAG: helix-turn-helix domain-containing protein [Haliea sp.]|nr:MAG: helix-turn-helix domain-containing protein [Haliea sp.]